MAQPERSFGKSFNRLGRLENAWAGALGQADTAQALDRLRRLYGRFDELGDTAAPLWLSFQQSVLGTRFLPLLLDADFDWLRDLGARAAAAGAFELGQAWWPLVEASASRASAHDLQRACRLLTDLYNAPSTREEIRLHAAARLARLEALGGEHLAVYADVVTRVPQPPAEVAALVGRTLDIGFDSEDEQLRRAYRLAARIGGPVPRADTAFALGVGELLLHRRPDPAARMFETALGRRAGHAAAIRGLLCAHLHDGDFRMAVAVGARLPLLDPRSADLLTLCQVLAWFEVRWKSTDPLLGSATPPATAARLAEIAPGRDTGPWRDYALGRAHLLDGDALRARHLLEKAVAAGLSSADARYHLAWAYLLCQDTDGVRTCYDALPAGAGKWALGCLVNDAEPGKPLRAGMEAEGPLTEAARARKALIGDGPIPERVDLPSLVTPDASQPDLFEALRTALGVAIARKQDTDLKTLLAQALFARLPAAERLIWTALALRVTDPERSRQMLRRALELGRDRAAVLLAHDALSNGRPGEIPQLPREVRGPKAELLRAWADAHAGDRTRAQQRLNKLSDRGLAQADYATAVLALCTAAEEWACGHLEQARTSALRASAKLRAATTRGMGRFEVSLLDHAAGLLATATTAQDLSWQDVADQPWTARLLALVRLVRGPETVDAALIQALADWPHDAAQFAAPISAVLRVAVCAQEATTRAEAARFLIQLDKRAPSTATAHAARSAAACVTQLSGEALEAAANDPLAALVGAGVALAEANLEEAVRRLCAATAEDAPPRLAALVTLLADALQGTPLPDPLPFNAPDTVAGALAAAAAAGHVAAGRADEAPEPLLRALAGRGVGGYVDLRRALPQLVRHAAKRGRRDAFTAALAPLVRLAAAEADEPGGIGELAAARYATVTGDFETAEAAWRRALDAVPEGDERREALRGEYGRFVCHRAALAELGGDRSTALARLRLAVSYLPDRVGRVLEDLEAEQLLHTLLRAILPGSPAAERQRPGRHPVLTELIAVNPGLRNAVCAGDADRILEQWRLATEAAGHDIELWHTLAILAREDALARPAGARAADRARIAATALWTVLLTEPALHARFEARTLPGEADDELRKELLEDLLVGLKVRFTQALAEADPDTAALCVGCLDVVRRGLEATRALLADGPFSAVAAAQAGDEQGFAPIAERAARLIDEWGADLVAAAERKLTDGEAIKRLGVNSKLDKNYEEAIAELEIAVLLDCPQRRVLRTALNYGYDWWVCMHTQGETDTALAAIDTVTPFAELLAAECTPGRPHVAENKALCDYYYALGLARMRLAKRTGNDALLDQAIDGLEQSAAWNPDDDAVRRELARARGRRLFRRGEYAEAERVLRDVRDNGRELAVLFNDYGIDRLNDARALLKIARTAAQVDDAQDPADESERMLIQAAKLDAADPTIRRNVKLIQDFQQEIEQTRMRLGPA